MNSMGYTENTISKLAALENLVCGIDLTAHLPGQVFRGIWSDFWFMESDQLFSMDTMNGIIGLLSEDIPDYCCILNLSEVEIDASTNPIYMVKRSTSTSEFNSRLYSRGIPDAWIYGRDRFGFSSSTGQWCIYCERENDVAVIAFRDIAGSLKYASALSNFHAEQLLGMLAKGATGPVPFNALTPQWRKQLVENYADIT